MNKSIIIYLSFFLVISCNTTEKAEEPVSEKGIFYDFETVKKLPIGLGNIEQVIMNSSIELNGMVDVPPDQTFEVSFPIAGKVSKITHNILPGRWVKKGEVLAQIESLELLQIKQEYVSENLKNELLKKEYERQKSLFSDDAGAKRKLEEAENNLKVNQLNIKALFEKIRILGVNPNSINSSNISGTFQLTSPQNAYIKSVNISNGKSIVPGDVLFELISTEHLHVELKVFGETMNQVKTGQKVEFPDENGSTIMGQVYLIDRTVDPEQKALNIHVHIENEAFEKTLKPGQYISGKLVLNNQKVNALPESAIVKEDNNYFVFVRKKTNTGYLFEKISVKTGQTVNNKTEILSPLNIEFEIVTEGQSFLSSQTED